uniref:Uncharacterized protein n=1 Tax=Amphimedon queenslandica TaxID=400682 RepID=A0A1X7UWJ7_AMPQE
MYLHVLSYLYKEDKMALIVSPVEVAQTVSELHVSIKESILTTNVLIGTIVITILVVLALYNGLRERGRENGGEAVVINMEEGFVGQQEIHKHVEEATDLNETKDMEERSPYDNYTVSPIVCTEAPRTFESQWVV